MKKTYVWNTGHSYIKVGKKKFENFRRFFGDKLSGNSFMEWTDVYDWSLVKKEKDYNKWLNECMVARVCWQGAPIEYYIRLDYIEKMNYDLNTIVSKPRKKRLTKKEKIFADHLCQAFDYAFARYSQENSK